jgi:hypothetical protein
MDERDGKTAALTEVNGGIVVMACECGRADCHEHVFLTFAAHCAIRDDSGSVLAPRHQVSHAERASRRAQRVRDDAAA